MATTTQAAPLVAELQKATLQAGGHLEYHLAVEGTGATMRDYASPEQAAFVGALYKTAMQDYEAYLNIRAPFDLRAEPPSQELRQARREAFKPYHDIYFRRTAQPSAPGGLKRSLCVYPCPALAEEAGMSLDDYTAFVMKATKVDQTRPRSRLAGRPRAPTTGGGSLQRMHHLSVPQ